jgi:hypothetical protein
MNCRSSCGSVLSQVRGLGKKVILTRKAKFSECALGATCRGLGDPNTSHHIPLSSPSVILASIIMIASIFASLP